MRHFTKVVLKSHEQILEKVEKVVMDKEITMMQCEEQ